MYRKVAFTLVELIVVIGLITLLLAMLFPMIHKIVQHGQRARCISQLHQIGGLAQAFGSLHNGTLPLAGTISMDPTGVFADLSAALSDSARKQFLYETAAAAGFGADTPFGSQTLPFSLALLAGQERRTSEFPGGLDADALEQSVAALAIFHCPAVNRDSYSPELWVGKSQATFTCGGQGLTSIWRIDSDYALNGAALGFDYRRPHSNLAARGRTNGLQDSSQIVLAGDANVKSAASDVWEPTNQSSLPLSLDQISKSVAGPRLNSDQHQGLFNLLCLDGHVETRRGTEVRDLYLAR